MFLFYFLVFLCLSLFHVVDGRGDGPIGLYVIDSQTALVGDSDRNAIFLVNIRTGGAIAKLSMEPYWKTRMTFDPQSRTGDTPHIVGIASCHSCEYFLATFHTMHLKKGKKSATTEHILRFVLKNPLAAWRDGNVGLEDAIIVDWTLPPGLGVNLRMVTLDETGKRAYVADTSKHSLHKGSILSFDPLFSPNITGGAASEFTEIATLSNAKSVHWTDRPGELLAAGTGGVVFINLTTGDTCTVSWKKGNCWNALIDPTREDTLVIFCMSDNSLHEVTGVRRNCVDKSKVPLQDGIGGFGWLDGDGEAHFARPHYMSLVPSLNGGKPTEILLSDIDNGVLRLVQLGPQRWRTSTILYDYTYDRLTSTYATHTHFPSLKASIGNWKSIGEAMSWPEANITCARMGARLCTAYEASIGQEQDFFRYASWTSYACHSCWHPYPGECTGKAMEVEGETWEGGHMTTQVLETPEGVRIVENRCIKDSEPHEAICCGVKEKKLGIEGEIGKDPKCLSCPNISSNVVTSSKSQIEPQLPPTEATNQNPFKSNGAWIGAIISLSLIMFIAIWLKIRRTSYQNTPLSDVEFSSLNEYRDIPPLASR